MVQIEQQQVQSDMYMLDFRPDGRQTTSKEDKNESGIAVNSWDRKCLKIIYSFWATL